MRQEWRTAAWIVTLEDGVIRYSFHKFWDYFKIATKDKDGNWTGEANKWYSLVSDQELIAMLEAAQAEWDRLNKEPEESFY